MATAATTRVADPASRGHGRGRVLAAAFDEAERQPALVESRDQALELITRGAPAHEVAAVVESDVGLTCAVVRSAGQLQGGGRIRSVPEAVERLGPGAAEAILRSAPTYDLFNGNGQMALGPDRFRLHALSVQRAADRVAEEAGYEERDELALAAILHDIGRTVLARLHPGYAERFDRRGGTPDDRIAAERRELGIDHSLVGGVLTRRWGLHSRIAEAIERHHSEQADGAAAVIRVADIIVAYLEESPVSLNALLAAGSACGLDEAAVRKIVYEIPRGTGQRRRVSGPCPLSARELDVLRRLAEGKVYKQIAAELDLSASTVRSHLHNVYGKLGALDRAQAVLMATEQGWI
ncbi:MAG TPA: HDOD domain-containing protein [Solirubrobacterales bacterium]|nr:HDOD domain-containing protein [Solirubrobacterales bacterium]